MITEAFQKQVGFFHHKVTPFRHQDQLFNQTRELKEYAILWEMGVGKTKPLLDTAAWLFLRGEIDGLLVVSDNGAYRCWTDYEIPIHMTEQVPCRVGTWASYMRREQEHQCEQLLVARDDVLDILVMPVESFSSRRAPVFAEAFLRAHYSMMCVDESVSIKNPAAERTRSILMLGRAAEYRRIMTGTPITNSPMDLFSQFEFLRPGMLGFTSFVAFRNFYARLMLVDLGRGRKFYQIVGYQNLQLLTKSIEPYSSRLLKRDCLDLPEKLYETLFVELTPEQRRAYDLMRDTAVYELDQGMVTATSAITALVKLHQICCGHVRDDEGNEHDIPSNRVSALLELLEKIPGKVIIWAYFRRDIELICEALPENSYVSYYGGTDQADRPEHIRRFRTDEECRYFVSNPAVGGKGNTLVESCHSIYFSQSFNLNHRVQSEDRNHRPGQRCNVTYTDVVAAGTVDVKIVKALRSKRDLASQVLDVYRELLS